MATGGVAAPTGAGAIANGACLPLSSWTDVLDLTVWDCPGRGAELARLLRYPILASCALYILVVRILEEFMRPRAARPCKIFTFAWNLSLSVLSLGGFYLAVSLDDLGLFGPWVAAVVCVPRPPDAPRIRLHPPRVSPPRAVPPLPARPQLSRRFPPNGMSLAEKRPRLSRGTGPTERWVSESERLDLSPSHSHAWIVRCLPPRCRPPTDPTRLRRYSTNRARNSSPPFPFGRSALVPAWHGQFTRVSMQGL